MMESLNSIARRTCVTGIVVLILWHGFGTAGWSKPVIDNRPFQSNTRPADTRPADTGPAQTAPSDIPTGLSRGDDFQTGTISQPIRRNAITQRLRLTAVLGFGLLALLGVLFGYLRINHATRGFYNRRLQTMATLLASAILITVFYLASVWK